MTALIWAASEGHFEVTKVLLVAGASIAAPATSRSLVTSKWPARAAHMRAVYPAWWKYVNERKYNIRYDYQYHIVEYYTLIHK